MHQLSSCLLLLFSSSLLVTAHAKVCHLAYDDISKPYGQDRPVCFLSVTFLLYV